VNTGKETSHSFLVRIRLETRELQNAEPVWRGDIEHIKTGTHTYFDHLDEIAVFLRPYLEEMGTEINKLK
jgi:hypothetical protein